MASEMMDSCIKVRSKAGDSHNTHYLTKTRRRIREFWQTDLNSREIHDGEKREPSYAWVHIDLIGNERFECCGWHRQ